jgi:hypothetical protein
VTPQVSVSTDSNKPKKGGAVTKNRELIPKTVIPASTSKLRKIGITKFCDRYFVICDLIL